MTDTRPDPVTKPKRGRLATHYDTIPHGNCTDPVRCDCECEGCMKEWHDWKEKKQAEWINLLLWS